MREAITPEDVLDAYCMGIFPMAEKADDEDIFWVDPDMRGIIPLDDFHVPRRLRRFIQSKPFEVSTNSDFAAVMAGCAQTSKNRRETWINRKILDLYNALHQMGYAHSVECRDAAGQLCGGLYGIAIGGAFFGESMFSVADNASKVALVYLAERLKARGFTLLDCQFTNPHLVQFGCIEIPRAEYQSLLAGAVSASGVSFVGSFDI